MILHRSPVHSDASPASWLQRPQELFFHVHLFFSQLFPGQVLKLLASLALLISASHDLLGQEPAKPTLAIVNATIDPVGSEVIQNGRILIADDLIMAMGGSDLAIPAGVETIDATGLTLTPGWIDLASQLWLSRSGNDEGINDGSLMVLDGLDAFSDFWKDVILSGVTTVYVQPGSQNAIGGLGAAVAVVPVESGKLIIHNQAAGLQMSLGRFASNRDRAARFEALKNSLQAVADYKKKWDEYEESVKKEKEKESKSASDSTTAKREGGESPNSSGVEPAQGVGGPGTSERRSSGMRREGFGGREGQEGRSGLQGRSRPEGQATPPASDAKPESPASPASSPPAKPKKPDLDPVKQRLLGVLRGEIPVRLEVHNANDAHYALELRQLFPDMNWILEDVDQLGSAVNVIRESRLPLVMGAWANLSPVNVNDQQRLEQSKRLLQGLESLLVITSDGQASNSSQTLREHLAVACAYGLPRERALKAVTLDAAKLIGCEKKLGILAAGYKADIVGFAGSPLDTSVPVHLVISHGKIVSQRTKPMEVKTFASNGLNEIPSKLPQKFQLHSPRFLTSNGYSDLTLTIADGKVAAVEPGFKDNGSDVMIELGEHVVTPGLQSVYATLGLDNQLRGAESNSAHLSPSDLTTLDSELREAIVRSGLHTVALTTGSTNTLPGQISLSSLSSHAQFVPTPIGSKIVLSGEARSMERYPSSLAGQVKFVRDALSRKIEPSRLFVPEPTLETISKLKQGVMEELLNQKQLAVFWVTNDAEVEAALQIIDSFKLKAALSGVRHIEKYAERLKSLNVSLMALPAKESDYPGLMSEVIRCHGKGVKVYFSGEDGFQLRLTAARAVQAGMAEAVAIHAITHGIQDLYGLDNAAGDFKAGNVADLIIWSGNPLDLTSRPILQICSGEVLTEKDKP